MKRFIGILLFVLVLLASCAKEVESPLDGILPEGTPVTMTIGFGADDLLDIELGTKAEASRVDESRIHDLYVLLFDSNGTKFYGRYFTYEHMSASLRELDSNSQEGWFVENISSSSEASAKTRGAVKISTESRSATLVLFANISNTIASLDSQSPIDFLADVQTLTALKRAKVTLEQLTVNRGDLFLMMGTREVETGSLVWGSTTPSVTYSDDSRIVLHKLDAKVKFCIRYNPEDADSEDWCIDPTRCTPRYWQVFNVPDRCRLFADDDSPMTPSYFSTHEAYFEGVEGDYQVFSFYMLENLQEGKKSIMNLSTPSYYLREKETNQSPRDWEYAPLHGTYVQFKIILGLTVHGISEILQTDANHALTTEALYTVHLGDFGHSDKSVSGWDFDKYDVERGTSYTYYITLVNSESIYVEVDTRQENEAGHEGSLLLATDEIVNCDAHYEYHTLTFSYDSDLLENGVSWYVKTPFGEGGAQWNGTDWDFDCDDYLWVTFGVNGLVDGKYTESRHAYPGDQEYDKDWRPNASAYPGTHPALMDIHQLITYIFDQTRKKKAGKANDFDSDEKLRVTAFVNEYYYETDPRTGQTDPDLWREFVNAKPRELHILADAKYSPDGRSDVITSSHSIIQNSIQTFYNISSPDLTSLWGTEHVDEMDYRTRKSKDDSQQAWGWLPSNAKLPDNNYTANNDDNGRYNTASLWGINSGSPKRWDSFLNYDVSNNVPELKDQYHYLAYSCLTRNRDNNHDFVIDPDELRWYIAATNQVVGMWIGNESLSPSARIYQPVDASNTTDDLLWRSWVISSTASDLKNPRTTRAEEGGTKSDYTSYGWTGLNEGQMHQLLSVRCVRNIGTYNVGGEIKDISEAPFDQFVDQYYEVPAGVDKNNKIRPNADGTYTILFSRLNSRSIREYTAEELPEHEEYSIHNQVYLELTMQDPADKVYEDGSSELTKDLQGLNTEITTSGHNSYCPPGYRLPNMTELAVMTTLLPSSYWSSNTDHIFPGRTYYSRRASGSNPTYSEREKLGWGFDKNIFHMKHINHIIKGIRCVRDINNTGEITGKVIIPDADRLTLNDPFTIRLNFTSQGSAIRSVSLSLVYIDTDGSEAVPLIIPLDGIELSGVTLVHNLSTSINDILSANGKSSLPVLGNLVIRATVRNSANKSKTVETPIRILSSVFASARLQPCAYSGAKETPEFPVLLTASSPSSNIDSWHLDIKSPDGETDRIVLPVQTDNRYWKYTYYFTYTTSTLLTGTYTFQLEVNTADGKSTRSPIASMDVLQANYSPNPNCESATQAADITGLWERQEIDGLDFYAGDFIEAGMDISKCVYATATADGVTPGDNTNLRRDNLISIGLTDTDYKTDKISVPYVFHAYYPSQSASPYRLRIGLSTPLGAGNEADARRFDAGRTNSGFIADGTSNAVPDCEAYQCVRLDGSGLFWNAQSINLSVTYSVNNRPNANATLSRLVSANKLFVGSTQGYHHSRARYIFVRAVHNNADSNASETGSTFEHDPVNGGEL